MQVWSVIFLSLQVTGTAVLASSVIGIPLGLWLGLSRFRGKWLVAAAVRTGLALPPVVVGLLLYLLLSRSGPLGVLDWLFTPQAMILAQIILTLPLVVGITMSSVEAIPRDLSDQIKSLGASDWQCRWAMLREARQGILLAIAAGFGRSTSEVGAVLMVGGNIQGHTQVLTTAIVLETGKGNFNAALLLGLVLLGIALLVNVLIMRLHAGMALS